MKAASETTARCPTFAEGKEKEQDIGNLFEKNSERKFPNMVKEIDIQVQEAQSPKQGRCKDAPSKTYHN